MKLAKVDSISTGLLTKSYNKQEIKWTNRYDCPPGYQFNEDGWVETTDPYPKVTISLFPYLLYRIGEHKLLLQNLLALRLLNDIPHSDLELVLYNRYKQALFGRTPDRDMFDKVVEESKSITNTTQLPDFCEDILRMDTIWYAQYCKENGKAVIKQKIRNNYITAVRSFMPISKKYITDEVMREAELTKYAVNLYWKQQELDSKNRTIASIVEAMQDLIDNGNKVTVQELINISGVSVRSIQRYKNMWMLERDNELCARS